MTVKFEVTEGEKWKRTVKVEIEQERIKAKFDEVYKTLKSEANLPGFRPGKVPLSTIKARFGDVAREDVLKQLLSETYTELLNETKLDPVTYPEIENIDIKDVDEDKPLAYTIQLEVRPVLELQKYTGFTLKQFDDTVKEGEVKEMLEYIQQRNSELEAVDRPAAEGDVVFVDLEVLEESSGKLEEKNFTGVQIEMKTEGVAGQFCQQLDSKSAGEETDLEIDYPEDHFDKRFAGHQVRFHAKINAVKHINLIEFNEEFFKQFDDSISNVEEFKEKLKEDIQRRKSKEAQDMLREEAIKETIDKNRFDLPEGMINNYLDSVVKDFRESYKEDYDEAEVRQRYRATAIRMIRWNLLMHKIAGKEKISASQEDIDSWIARFADNYNITHKEAKERITSGREISNIKESVLENKVLDFIIGNSTTETIISPMVKPDEEQHQGGSGLE